MKAMFKGKLNINTITFTQDSVGGMIENHVPIIQNLRFVGRQSSKNEITGPAKFVVETETIFYVKLPKSINESNLSEKDYIVIGCQSCPTCHQCYDIREVNFINAPGEYGAEIRAVKRK